MTFREPEGGIMLPTKMEADRKTSTKSSGHFTGSLIVPDEQGLLKVMDVESHTEMMIAICMIMRPNVHFLQSQVRYDWFCEDEQKPRWHFFDFIATLTTGERVAVVVKSERKRRDLKLQALVRSMARSMRSDFAHMIVIMTERHLDPTEKHNAQFLYGLKENDEEADRLVRAATHNIEGAVSIGSVVEKCGLYGRAFRAVGRLIRSGELRLTRIEKISNEALIERGCTYA